MRKLLLVAVAAFLCAAPLAHAQMPSEKEWTRNIEQWQARMKTMHEQMEKIAGEQDPQQRQKLLAEHWQVMSEQMNEMNMMGGGMMGPGMMGRGMMGRGMMGQHGMMGPGMMGAMCGCPMFGMMQMMMHQHMMTMHGDSSQRMQKRMHEGMRDDMMQHD